VTLGLVQEILNAVDVILLVSEEFRMVDPVMLELRDVQHVVGAERIRIHDTAGTILLSMILFNVLPLAFTITFAYTLPPRFSRLKTGTFPAAPRPRWPLRLPPK